MISNNKSKQENMSKFTGQKTSIIKSGFLSKRSKYLKMWNKRFIILTNKNIFSYINDDRSAECTMNLDIKDCKMVYNSNSKLSKENTLCISHKERDYFFQASSEIERNEWILILKKVITNPGIVSEQEEIDYADESI